METYRELVAWQKGMALVLHVYQISREFPKEEIYGLTNQMRRAAVSIPSSLAEGFGRNTKAEMARYAHIGMGSLFELQTQLEIACNLQLIDSEVFNAIFDECRELERILSAFIKSIS